MLAFIHNFILLWHIISYHNFSLISYMYFVTVDFNIEQFKDFWWVLDFYIWAYFDTSLWHLVSFHTWIIFILFKKMASGCCWILWVVVICQSGWFQCHPSKARWGPSIHQWTCQPYSFYRLTAAPVQKQGLEIMRVTQGRLVMCLVMWVNTSSSTPQWFLPFQVKITL